MQWQNEACCACQLSLDGEWEIGLERRYERTVQVPGLATDPAQMTEGTLWYRRTLELPGGNWTHATLVLKGARFCPVVYVNGEQVSARAGGMTVTTHLLASTDVMPGATIVLEIALRSLRDLDPQDASYISKADQWRSNISSCLWDHVELRLHGPARLTRLVPAYDRVDDHLSVAWTVEQLAPVLQPLALTCQILDQGGIVLAETQEPAKGLRREERIQGSIEMDLDWSCQLWSPEQPHCHRLRMLLTSGITILDEDVMTLGLKRFRTEGLGFILNEAPLHLRAGTVAWQRWLRDPEARELAFDVPWFEQNVVQRLKQHGANGLRFHLGSPPEAFLDLCDRYGLLVQIEWHFFHDLPASLESLREQWRNWLDLCMRHPSICLIQPWNETEDERVVNARAVLAQLAEEYPPFVLSHRDVLHVHRYWWSLFENLGLYYDSASEFPQPAMVDEFGGNYLDGAGNPGKYPALAESFARFLGREHTAEQRLQLQCEATTQIAEYWRRLGVAGFSPFCILGSPEDGSHYFLGHLREGLPKPVWNGLTAAYAPRSCSLDVWNRHYLPGQQVYVPLYLFNDSSQTTRLVVQVGIGAEEGTLPIMQAQTIECSVQPHGMAQQMVKLQLPRAEGRWRLEACLQDSSTTVTYPIVSSWRISTRFPHIPERVQAARLGIPADEQELRACCEQHGLQVCSVTDVHAQVIVMSATSWAELSKGGEKRLLLEQALQRCQSVLLLDIGPQRLGYGYEPDHMAYLRENSGEHPVEQHEYELVFGTRLRFRSVIEPESCIHPGPHDARLWKNLDRQDTWLWNGLRGGLIVPAVEMEVLGLDAESFLTLWQTYGADGEAIQHDADYCAYELAGYYAFAHGEDEGVAQQLRERVMQRMQDAPASQPAINPYASLVVQHLSTLYRYRQQQATPEIKLSALASCGKNLVRSPILQLDFGQNTGRLLLSQLITRGRLAQGDGGEGLYDICYDPVAVQFVLNMLDSCLL